MTNNVQGADPDNSDQTDVRLTKDFIINLTSLSSYCQRLRKF